MYHNKNKNPSKALTMMTKLEVYTKKIYGKFFLIFVIGHPTRCVHDFLTGNINSKDLFIIQYYIFSGLGLCAIIKTQIDNIYYSCN